MILSDNLLPDLQNNAKPAHDCDTIAFTNYKGLSQYSKRNLLDVLQEKARVRQPSFQKFWLAKVLCAKVLVRKVLCAKMIPSKT